MRRNLWLPGFAFGFIETFVPTLTRDEVLKAFGD
jgi:LysR family cys regulon transcriptional activator